MIKDEYSNRSRLINRNAEDGDTAGWTVTGVIATPGGPGTSSYCFQLAPTASMSQVIQVAPTPDAKIGGFFLPEYPTIEPEKKVFIKLTSHHAEGTDDIHVIPCVESVGELNELVR